jgi:prepilin-type N-terminal cleavage/methylation domain-containing protein
MVAQKKNHTRSGFTLIESIVALAVFSILVVTFYNIFIQSATHLNNSKMRRAAVALSNERMEHFRNLPYDRIGTVENAPFGDIVDDEIVTVNNMQFRVISSVFFIDDPTDGSAPTDVLFEDYKRISVTVVWGPGAGSGVAKGDAEYAQEYGSKRVHLISQFVPPGGMETVATGGILSINVLDTDANPIENAFVTIYDRVRDATVTALTDGTGNYMYIGAPVCEHCYEISVEKDQYETVATGPVYDGAIQIYDPRFIHQSVIAGELTTAVIQIDRVSELKIITKDVFGNIISDVDGEINGGRALGTDPTNAGAIVYNFDAIFVTDANGEYAVDTDTDNDGDVDNSDKTNPGPYFFTINEPDYVLWKAVPGDILERNKTNVLAGTTGSADLILLDKEYDSAWFRVVDIDGVPIDLATVQLKNATLGYDVSLQTDMYGYVFFPENATDVLENGKTYDVVVNATGYEELTDTIVIDKLTQQELILNK